ncbi:THO complex subunit 5 homolog [Toxorhynchites rutilus septentrionalis]|uniref:THO complex subunit 5 homolog n=1 Tax=Toxorhynchites rutilus septentrionalis TaxID=329112 RepID=UPI00247A0445|nr:THO complex subunit 5 homolog [Toxorhynchites rutilus septentrionalis]
MVNKVDLSDRDVSDKKRRKTTTIEAPPAKLTKEDLYVNTIAFEEQEASKRSPEKDAQLFHSTCDELRKLFDEIAALKKENSEEARLKIADKRIDGSLAFVALKKLNRLDKVRIRDGKEALHKEKLRVDSNRLQLQNLLYEADHLRKEVQRCYLFKSQDEEIELVPVEEFYANAPSSIARPEKTKNDEHARRIARLEWELQQRKELDALCKELHSSKAKVAEEIVSKTERLDSLAPRLKDLLAATRPLQEALDMPIEKGWEVQKTIRLLVQPLYMLYANVTAYGEACDSSLSTTVQGDEDEARQIEFTGSLDCDSDDDGGNEREARGSYNRRKTSKHQDPARQKRKALAKPHPLSVTIAIKSKEGKESLALTFHYVPNAGFVTVKCALVDFEISGVAAGDVMSKENILNELFPNDNGEGSPNPKTKFQLQEIGVSMEKFGSMMKERDLGKPYKWAQELCGVEFVNSGEKFLAASDKWQNTIPVVIKAIRTRWEARIKLYQQIHELEIGTVDTSINMEHNNPVRISSTLVQWTALSYAEYVGSNVTEKFVDQCSSSPNDLYFRAIVTRGSAKLECYICVPCDFPESTALWSFSLNWNGKHSAADNAAVRDMEYWTNSLQSSKHQKSLLSLQLKRAMSCLDIYLETEGCFNTPPEFTQDKTYLKPFRGRARARPFRLVSSGSSSVFTQI